jgi:cytochrome c oxidase cbb3-type subunit 3/ubiquinol-cytochrome c reductase cytochrome c subunit
VIPLITAALMLVIALAGCDRLPGKPRPSDRDLLPSQVLSFPALYHANCAGCHGADGRFGGSRPLNDPLYLALVPRERLRDVIARGVAGTSQPAFAQAAGGTLTDAQLDALVRGLPETWGRPDSVKGVELPPYAGPAPGDPARGKDVYAKACAGCHGADGKGGPKGGAVAEASYLALVTDQYLRTTVIAGRSDLGMPDWRGYLPGAALTGDEISDVVAWLSSARRPVPGRPASAMRP